MRNLQANYKSQGKPKLWVSDTQPEFLGVSPVRTPTTPTVAAPQLKWI